jgi:predicted nucleotidyltransferase
MNFEEVTKIREGLAFLKPAAVYLFGSAASGRARPDSDIDLAVLAEGSLSTSQLLRARILLAESLSRDVDLIDLARASTVLRKEVLAGGRLLYETGPSRRAEFEMYTLSDYARLNEERAPVLAVLRHPLSSNA